MSIHIHTLKGCSPAPLANYLKALGILRLVGNQADPKARGWWDGERFCLMTTLSKEELEKFFLEQYEPTPIFNPWGGRSGYYPEQSEKTARNALISIEFSVNDRLATFRHAIAVIRSVINAGGGEKPDAEDTKSKMIARIRMGLRGSGSDWLDTVIADLGDSFRGPAIFGTGGNEGSGSYTASFLAAVVECILGTTWNSSIAPSLWSDGSDRDSWDGGFQAPIQSGSKKPKKESVNQPFRQYLPGTEGSPWDLLLAFEGAIVVQSGVVRRSSTDRHRFLTSPFYFAPNGMGAASSSEMDEFTLNKGRKNPGRGEQWFPMWSTPSTFHEIQLLFREGRCSTGRRTAKNPLDAARAICGIGTTNGISAFVRYGYLQRDNLATHFAVPLGRIRVSENLNARLIDDLKDWLDRIHREARKKNAPARLGQAEKRLADSVFSALTHDHTPERWQAILLAAADIETLQATGTGIDAGPTPSLRPEWISAIDDGSAEVRLALALGSSAAEYKHSRPVDSVRHHWLPLEDSARKFKTSDKRLVNDVRVVASGRDAMRDLAAVVERRMIEAGMKGERRSRLVAAAGCGARLDDLAQFLAGQFDVDKIVRLARAFMALRWDEWKRPHIPPQPPISKYDAQPDEAWLAIRLVCLPFALGKAQDIPADERVVRLLNANNASQAIEIARRRIRAVGIRPPFQFGTADAETTGLWAAALAFPINHETALKLVSVLDPRSNPKKGMLHV